MAELKQTKGYASFRGILGGLDRTVGDIAEGKSNKNYSNTDKIKKLKFSIKTSDDNVHFVDVTQFKTGKSMDKAYISKRDADTGKYETQAISWSDRNKELQDGWNLIGISLKSSDDENTKNMVAFDAIDYILENFKDGDSVFLNADITHSDYNENRYVNYGVKKMFASKSDIEFEAEDFEEQADFEETIIFNTCYPDENGLQVLAYAVDYSKSPIEIEFVVKNEDKEVMEYVESNLSNGDLVTVAGLINNRIVYEWTEIPQETEDDGFKTIGRKTKTEGNKSKPKREKNIISEDKSIQIIGLDPDSIKSGLYSEEDFMESTDTLPFW